MAMAISRPLRRYLLTENNVAITGEHRLMVFHFVRLLGFMLASDVPDQPPPYVEERAFHVS